MLLGLDPWPDLPHQAPYIHTFHTKMILILFHTHPTQAVQPSIAIVHQYRHAPHTCVGTLYILKMGHFWYFIIIETGLKPKGEPLPLPRAKRETPRPEPVVSGYGFHHKLPNEFNGALISY